MQVSPSPLASNPYASKGREFPVTEEGARGPRSAFQRDRDRIIHSIAFRRLRSKTQVFIAPDGDHYRTRLTHSLEVAQIGRVIARALGLDEDLTEALCLAHDLGHPPFGHAGEEALAAATERSGGFDHNAHALRILMRLECPYPAHDGLNLSWEVLEGLAKHNGPVAAPNWALAELNAAFDLQLGTYASLEAQVAAVADDIAYDNHDIDDGLRAGLLDLDQILAVDMVADEWRSVERRFPHAPQTRKLRELVRSQIGVMVNDVIANTKAQISGISHADEVRGAGQTLAGFSPIMAAEERKLKRFMYANLYHHGQQLAAANRATEVIAALFVSYAGDVGLLSPAWQETMPQEEPARTRHITDYVAGMTDRYAIDQYQKLFGRVPEGLSHV